jgi:hypothetical protein
MQLELDEREASVLNQVLTNYLPELRGEVANTENYEWRQDLKRSEEVIKALIERLQPLLAGRVNFTS